MKRPPSARRAVVDMQAYRPPLEGRRSKIRLDFNENTQGFPEHFAELEPTLVTAYPEYEQVLQTLAAHLKLPEENLLLTNGSDEGLFVAAFTFIEPNEDVAVVAAPTFSLIPHYLQLCQASLREVLVHDDLSANLEGLESALKGARLAMWASPDNPTGATLPLPRLSQWLREFPETLFVIDEAYFEYFGETALPLVLEHPNLVVSRTFSKAWGLAGLRLGFLAAHPQVIEWMRRVRSPYSVNSVAAQTLLRILPDQARVEEQAREVMARKARVLAALQSMSYRVTAGGANFFVIWAGLTSQALSAYLYEQGILVRDRSTLARMGGSVRVSVGGQEEMERFLEAVRNFQRSFALIFDLDDTLVDCSQSYDLCVQKLSGCDRSQLLALRAEGGFNDDWDAAAELLRRAGRPKPLEQVQREGKALYLELAASVEPPFFRPGLLESLARRHPLFLYTGRPRDEYEPLWGARLTFEGVLCRDEVERPKPDPEGLLKILERYRLTGGVYLGNSVDDMRAARAAGLTAIGVTSNQSAEVLRQAGAEVVVGSVNELEDLLGGLV